MAHRNTATRDRHRRYIARSKPACHICGGPIDYTLPHLDPGAFVVDHLVPLARGGADEVGNKAAAHRACNRAKWDREEPAARLTPYVTGRTLGGSPSP